MKNILFVCVENSCRSQMAEGFANHAKSPEDISAFSAGSRPSGRINPKAVNVMEEVGIDISEQKSKDFEGLSSTSLKQFDYVVGMGCEDVCPFIPAKKSLKWDIEDPKGKDLETFRKVRNDIRERVNSLIKEINS